MNSIAKILETYKPFRMGYTTNRGIKKTVHGVIVESCGTMLIGEDSYFMSISGDELIKANDKLGRKIGTITDFKLL